ncbi:hypothetical protein HDV01_000429, partial [Terramyces sp. JEL0728]
YYEYAVDERAKYEGCLLRFSGDEKQWPGAFFLTHHNKSFDFRERQRKIAGNLKAGAEPKDYSRQDSDTTIDYHFECLDYRKTDWINTHPEKYDPWDQDVKVDNNKLF